MKLQPNKNYKSDDVVMTPEPIAEMLVQHFKPIGRILEPCKGTGNFLKFLPEDTLWCEIKENRDFMDFNEQVDWIITNPPWSKIRPFLKKSMEVADNVCFLLTINHLWTKARLRDIKEARFGIREILVFNAPKELNNSGFACGMIHLKKGYEGDIRFVNSQSNDNKKEADNND